jgi:hypothetical protein
MQKYWVHEKTKGNCFLLFPKALSITWCEDPWFWNWHPLKETRYSLAWLCLHMMS